MQRQGLGVRSGGADPAADQVHDRLPPSGPGPRVHRAPARPGQRPRRHGLGGEHLLGQPRAALDVPGRRRHGRPHRVQYPPGEGSAHLGLHRVQHPPCPIDVLVVDEQQHGPEQRTAQLLLVGGSRGERRGQCGLGLPRPYDPGQDARQPELGVEPAPGIAGRAEDPFGEVVVGQAHRAPRCVHQHLGVRTPVAVEPEDGVAQAVAGAAPRSDDLGELTAEPSGTRRAHPGPHRLGVQRVGDPHLPPGAVAPGGRARCRARVRGGHGVVARHPPRGAGGVDRR